MLKLSRRFIGEKKLKEQKLLCKWETIHKSRGATIQRVGTYLNGPVFLQKQIYDAVSSLIIR